MPLHEFRCEACGHGFELLVRSEEELRSAQCTACGGAKLARQFSTFAVQGGSDQSSPATCCGRPEPCEAPPCAEAGTCRFGD